MAPQVEIRRSAWFGPKSRAYEFLARRTTVLEPDAAARIFEQIVSTVARRESITRIRFHDYLDREHRFRYTIAVVWTTADWPTREMLFSRAEDFVRRTGWYPIAQGEYLESRDRGDKFARTWAEHRDIGSVNCGQMVSIETGCSPEDGCAIRIRCEGGNLLLDTGFRLEPSEGDRIALVSHSHADHSGGIEHLAAKDISVVVSTGTARWLLASKRVRSSVGQKTFVLVPERDGWHHLGDGLEFRPFLVPHSVGAVGFVLRDRARALVYSGDVVLRSGRHDFQSDLVAAIAMAERKSCTLLLDATMLGRREGATQELPAQELLKTADPEFLIVSRDVEQLLYAYLDLYHSAKADPVHRWGTRFVITEKLRPLFEILHDAFIVHDIAGLDPFLAAQYGANMSSWGESTFLYWYRDTLRLPRGDNVRTIWLMTESEMSRSESWAAARVLSIGKPVHLSSGDVVANDEIDTTAWTLHSNDSCLREVIPQLAEHARVVLFHGYPDKLRRHVRQYNLPCEVLSSSALQL